jgi:hypothetical protein
MAYLPQTRIAWWHFIFHAADWWHTKSTAARSLVPTDGCYWVVTHTRELPWESRLHLKLAKQASYIIRPTYSSHYHIRTLCCSNWPTTKVQEVRHYIIVIRCKNTNLVTLYGILHSQQSCGSVVVGGVVSGSCAVARLIARRKVKCEWRQFPSTLSIHHGQIFPAE